MNNKYMLLLSLAGLLNLNSCCARKPERPASTPRTTETTTQEAAPYGTVVDFADMVKEHGSETAALNKIKSVKKVVIDFFATWCPPCRELAPNFIEAAKLLPDILFVKVNAEQFIVIGKQFSVRSFPTLILLQDGEKVGALVGFRSKKALIDEINAIFNTQQ